MKRSEGLRYLTRCEHWYQGVKFESDRCPTCGGTGDAGHLRTFSRYGSDSRSCAPVAWRLAYLIARESAEEVTEELLDGTMSSVVNDSDEVEYIIRRYGNRQYR